jgi:hypothetical protein
MVKVGTAQGRLCPPYEAAQSALRRICRGSACICQLVKFSSYISSLRNSKLIVNLLSTERPFLLCAIAWFLRPGVSRAARAFCVAPGSSVGSAARNIAELRFGLSVLLAVAELFAIKIFAS